MPSPRVSPSDATIEVSASGTQSQQADSPAVKEAFVASATASASGAKSGAKSGASSSGEDSSSGSTTVATTDKADKAEKKAKSGSSSSSDSDVEAGAKEPDAEHALTKTQFALVMVCIVASVFIAALDQTIVATCLPVIAGELDGLDLYSWVVSAFLLTSTASQPLYGKFSDIFGRRLLMQISIAIFTLGSIASALAQTMVELVVFRAIQGLGAGGLTSLAMIILGDIVSPRERGKYAGLTGMSFGIASIAGPLVGGGLTDGANWRWVFWINLFIAVPVFILITVCLKVPHVNKKGTKIDISGSILFIGAVCMILVGLSYGGTEYPWDSATVLCLIIIGVFVLGLFVLNEWHFPSPIIDLSMFRIRTYVLSTIIFFVAGFTMLGILSYLPLYYQLVRGSSSTDSGLQTLPMILGLIITSIGSGAYISKTGKYRFFPAAGMALMVVSFFLFKRMTVDVNIWEIYGYLFIMGLGFGMILQTIILASQNAVPPQQMAIATSSLNFIRTAGSVVGVAVFGTLFRHFLNVQFADLGLHMSGGSLDSISPAVIEAIPEPLRHTIRSAFANALGSTFFWGGPPAVLGFVLSLFLPSIELRKTAAGEAPPMALD